MLSDGRPQAVRAQQQLIAGLQPCRGRFVDLRQCRRAHAVVELVALGMVSARMGRHAAQCDQSLDMGVIDGAREYATATQPVQP